AARLRRRLSRLSGNREMRTRGSAYTGPSETTEAETMRAFFPLLLILGCGTTPEEGLPPEPRAAAAGELRFELDPAPGGALEGLDGGGFVYWEGERRLSLHLVEFEPEPAPTLDWHA